MTMTQHTNCVVTNDKVQIVKLTLFKYQSRLHVLCEIVTFYCSLQSNGNVQVNDITSGVFSPNV